MEKIVDIIMPVYNAENYIEENLKKLEKQTLKNFRVIIIDDCSSDSTELKIKKFMENTKLNILFLKNNRNCGEGETRNRGLEYIQAKYILFLDCDDYLEEKALEILVQNIEMSQSDVVASGYSRVTKNGNIKEKYLFTEKEYREKEEFIPKIISKEIVLGIGNTLIKSDIIKKNNLKFKAYKYGADSNFIRELALYLKTVKIIKDVLFFYVINEFSVMNSKFSLKRFEGLEAIEDSIVIYQKNNIFIKDIYEKKFNFLYNLELTTIYTNILRSKEDIEKKLELRRKIRKIMIKDFFEIRTNRKYLVFLFIYFPTIFELLYKIKMEVRNICKK